MPSNNNLRHLAYLRTALLFGHPEHRPHGHLLFQGSVVGILELRGGERDADGVEHDRVPSGLSELARTQAVVS